MMPARRSELFPTPERPYRMMREDPRGDRFDFLFTAEKEGRVLFRVVVQEFVRTAGLRSGSWRKRGNLLVEYFNHIRYKHISMLAIPRA